MVDDKVRMGHQEKKQRRRREVKRLCRRERERERYGN